MAEAPTLLREASAIHRDLGRDRVPGGRVWDLTDYVPDILGSALRQRGGWEYQSNALTNAVDGMLFANFVAGVKLLAANGTLLREISTGAIGDSAVGSIPATLQNPVQHRDRVIIPAASGAAAAKFVTWNGATYTLSDAPVSALQGRLATVFKDRVILASSAAENTMVAFSKPGDPTVAWDSISKIPTSLPVSGLAAQRSQILVFHAGSVERIRGTTPPDSAASDPTGDMILDTLFDRAGCFDPRSIAYWNDNVIFCDARGVHITDGAVVRNMASQGGVESLWRDVFHEDSSRGPIVSVAGAVHRDIYIVTLRNTIGEPVTFAVDIPTRKFYRLTNINSAAYAFSVGIDDRLWGTDQTPKRVIDMTPVFSKNTSSLQVDGNGANVLPMVETGWIRMSTRETLKRVKALFVSYETGSVADDGTEVLAVSYLTGPSDTVYDDFTQGLKRATEYTRRKLSLGLRVLGLAIRIDQTVPTRDTRIYDVAVDVYPEEETRVR